MWSMLIRRLINLVNQSTGEVRVARFGRVEFVGLIGKRPLAQLTHQEIRNSFDTIELREAHNAHFVSRLIKRGPQFGIHDLNGFARAINNGVIRSGSEPRTFEVVFHNGRAAAVVNADGELVTFLPL